jgi:hypothetical protein
VNDSRLTRQPWDEGSDWYVVHPGDAFSQATIAAGRFTPLVTFGPVIHPPASVGDDFYLGISTGKGFDIPADRTVFGWVHLRQKSDGRSMVENVMSYASRGIIVGTTTIVPEPAAIAMGLVSGIAFVFVLSRTPPRRTSLIATSCLI